MPQSEMLINLLLEPSRDEYKEHLRSAVVAERLRHPDLVTELAMKTNGEAWDERLLLTRIDMVWGDPSSPELTNAELEPVPQDNVASEWLVDEVVVKVSRFRWHSCVVQLNPQPASWSPIWRWFDTWFDVEGQHQPDADGFESVIHGLRLNDSDADRGCIFTVDFGSAPTVCVFELIAACGRASVKEMTLE